jgi:hypothetical protein
MLAVSPLSANEVRWTGRGACGCPELGRTKRPACIRGGGREAIAFADPHVSARTRVRKVAVEAKRVGRYVPVTGPVTVDDEIRALVAELQRCECPCHAAGHDREMVDGPG